MKRIPNVFIGDPPTVNPDCQWVMDGEGTATRMYDGVCVLFDGQQWWARCKVPVGGHLPAGFCPVEQDLPTHDLIGWEPMSGSPHLAAHTEAVEPMLQFGAIIKQPIHVGTYELVGVSINGNPERSGSHRLEKHGNAEQFADVVRNYEGIRDYARWVAEDGIEGIVFQHPDGRMAKVRAKDFPA